MRPLLLVDVDGVLNNFWGGNPKKGWEQHRVLGYKLWLHPKHGEWLRSLSNRFDLVWATTWEQDAPTAIAPLLSLPEMPFVPLPDSDEPTWKLLGVKQYVGDRPFAWLDDDLAKDAHQWAEVRDRTVPTLMLDVDPRMCLLEHHVTKLERFAERVEGLEMDVSSDRPAGG